MKWQVSRIQIYGHGLHLEKGRIPDSDREEVLPQVQGKKCLGIMFTGEMTVEQEMDRWFGVELAVLRSLYWSIVVKREPYSEALDLLLHVRLNPHPWSRAVGNDRKKKVVNTSG